MPDQCFVLCDEEIGMAIAFEVDEFEGRIAKFADQECGEWTKCHPALRVVGFEQTGSLIRRQESALALQPQPPPFHDQAAQILTQTLARTLVQLTRNALACPAVS